MKCHIFGSIRRWPIDLTTCRPKCLIKQLCCSYSHHSRCRCWLTSVYMDLLRLTWLMSYIWSLIYPADVVFAQHRHWPSPFLRHASGQLVIVLFRQLYHGHGTLFHQNSLRRQCCQHLNLNWRHISFHFLFLIFSFLCTVTAVLCTIHFKFLIDWLIDSLLNSIKSCEMIVCPAVIIVIK